MWSISNGTPYKAERTAVIDKHGARHWIVVVKGTFSVLPGGHTEPAEEQLDPLLAPEYRGEPGKSSLLYEADLIDGKPGTDILVNGSAHAPKGKPVKEVNVGLRIAGRQKVLTVRGDRVYERDLSGAVVPSPPLPFVTMPITYERAYGGFDATDPDPLEQKMFEPNPVGSGVAKSSGRLVGGPVPNVEFPDGRVRQDAAPGFGALCSYWAPRKRYAGTYDGEWVKKRKPLLPLDYDERVNLCAPVDQQISPHLRPGGVTVELVNLTPTGALQITLPKIYLAFTTHFASYTGRRPIEHRSELHTVIIEPDHPRVVMVWHTRLSCGHAIDDIDRTTVIEKPHVKTGR